MRAAGLREALAALRAALEEIGAPYMIIGGVAVLARGVARLTQDVDATVWAEDLDIDDALGVMSRQHIEGRIAGVSAFARRHFVFLLRHRPTGTPLDVSLAWLPFERDALRRAQKVDVGGTVVPVADVESLVIYKAVAWRSQDQTDIERLVELHGDALDTDRILGVVAEFADALDDPGRVEDVRRLIERSLRTD